MTESFSYVMDMVDKQVGILSLVKGRRPDGVSVYAYVIMSPTDFARYQEDYIAGNIDLVNYGRVIRHGEGEEPSAQVQAEMANRFQADPDFASKLEEEIEKNFKSLITS